MRDAERAHKPQAIELDAPIMDETIEHIAWARRHGAVGIPLRGLEGNRPIDDPDFYVFPKLRFGCFEVGSSWLTYVVTQQLRILSANAEALFGPGWRRGRPYRNLHSRISASHAGRGFDARLSRVPS